MFMKELGDILKNTQERKRYPSKYLNMDSLSFKPTFRENKDPLITKHYDEIIELINNDNYNKVQHLISNKNWDDCNEHDYNEPDDMKMVGKDLVLTTLFEYSINNDDNKMLMIFINKDLFNNSCINILCENIIKPNKFDTFKIIMDNSNFDDTIMNTITLSIIYYLNENAMLYFKVISEKGFKFSDFHVKEAIINNNHHLIQYFFNEGYDIQTIFESLKSHHYNVNLDMLKIMHNNIDISKHINGIYIIALGCGKLDVIIYLLDHFQELELGLGMSKAFNGGQIEILKYLLGRGANITDIEPIENISEMKIETFKFLVHCGYPVTTLEYDKLLIKYFMNNDIQDVAYIVEYDNDHHKHIENIVNKNTQMSNSLKALMLFSFDNSEWSQPLEYIVSNGKIDHIKFLVDNYYDLIQPKINNMFVIACANGQIDMMKYLLGFDVDINIKAIKVACFFGHLEVVKILLELGEVFDDGDDLFLIVLTGYYLGRKASDVYDMLVDGDIFKNDVYYHGNGHWKIIELLMAYNVDVGKCEFMPLIKNDYGLMDFYKYIINHVSDVNEKFGGMYLLDTVIINKNYDVMKMLLENGVNAFDKSNIENDVECKSILAEYGLWDADDVCL